METSMPARVEAPVTSSHAPTVQQRAQQTLTVTWKAYRVTAIILALQILQSGWEPDMIICVGRGGMLVGEALCRMLKKTLGVVMAYSYHGEGEKTRGKLKIAEHISITKPVAGKVLFVDDLADSGNTFIEMLQYLNKINDKLEVRTGALYQKTATQFKPDYCVETIDKDTWLVFPNESFDKVSLEQWSPESLKGKDLRKIAEQMQEIWKRQKSRAKL